MDEEATNFPDPTVGSKRQRAPGSARVVQVEISTGRTIKIHPNKEAAAAAVGGLETFISTCMGGVVDEAYGFGWRYPTVEEEEELDALQRAEERELSREQEFNQDIQEYSTSEIVSGNPSKYDGKEEALNDVNQSAEQSKRSVEMQESDSLLDRGVLQSDKSQEVKGGEKYFGYLDATVGKNSDDLQQVDDEDEILQDLQFDE